MFSELTSETRMKFGPRLAVLSFLGIGTAATEHGAKEILRDMRFIRERFGSTCVIWPTFSSSVICSSSALAFTSMFASLRFGRK